MSRKFSIIKTVDLNKLNMQIDDYKCETYEENPYIFANGETIKAMCVTSLSLDNSQPMGFASLKSSFKRGKYEGYKIFQDDDLPFGEVEIR